MLLFSTLGDLGFNKPRPGVAAPAAAAPGSGSGGAMIVPLLQAPVPPETGGAVTPDQLPHLEKLCVLGDVQLSGAAPDALPAFSSLLASYPCRVGPFAAEGEAGFLASDSLTDAIVSWLDKGARRAVLAVANPTAEAAEAVAAWSQQLPEARSRLVVQLPVAALGATVDAVAEALPGVLEHLKPAVAAVQFDFAGSAVEAPALGAALKPLRGKEGAPTYLELLFHNLPAVTPALVGQLHKDCGVDVVTPSHVSPVTDDDAPPAPPPAGHTSTDAAAALSACLRSDRPDGLITTVVCDACGVALGLVYSNTRSLAASLAAQRGVYWSRSRGGLWRKGDTSGAWQSLLSITVDCDSDALRFAVVQHGAPPAFCHFNRRSCWPTGDGGLGALERTLAARRASAPPGSYTARLFNDAALLRNKLVEEAQELAEAAEPDDVASEAADVVYFALVRCAAAGVALADVEAWLDRRALKLRRRPGNAKAHRIEAGDAILQGRAAQQQGGAGEAAPPVQQS